VVAAEVVVVAVESVVVVLELIGHPVH